jgi:hypothetical protein
VSAALLFTKMVTWNKHIMHNAEGIVDIINITKILFLFLSSHFVILGYCDNINLNIADSSIIMTDHLVKIPKVTLEQFEEIVGQDQTTNNNLDKLKDIGGKFNVFAITDIGSDYKEALEAFYKEAPNCISGGHHMHNINIPKEVELPDGSTRRTYATEIKQYPDCLHMSLLSIVFDELENQVSKLLTKLNDNQEQSYKTRKGNNITLLSDAPIKDHIHVYTKRRDKSPRLNMAEGDNQRNEYLVPFHVDNGIYLLLTPFPNHGLEVELSNGKKVSTNDVDSESVLVLMGRGLTDWLLQSDENNLYHATPHAVPSLEGTDISTRSVYARMKVAPASAIPLIDINTVSSDKNDLKTFQEVFMEEFGKSDESSDLCSVHLNSETDRVHRASNDSWSHTLHSMCEAGEAYCWMSCRPLPSKCPSSEEAKCFSNERNITCG